jgi:hypothetical protein
VRTAALTIALAALLFALQDFFQNTRVLLARDRAACDALARTLAESVERGRASGAPPSKSEVDRARAVALRWRTEREQVERLFFHGATRTSDYLVRAGERPAVDGLARERAQLEALLVALPAELKSFAGASPERLGLKVPSLSVALPEGQGELQDQVRRALALERLLSAAHDFPGLAADALALERDRDGGVRLTVGAGAPLGVAVSFFESVLGAADDAPPRRLERLKLRRLPPVEWGTTVRRLSSPPVGLELTVGFDEPGRARPGGGAGGGGR